MSDTNQDLSPAERQARIEALVRQLGETEDALQALLEGQVDAVVDPVRGTPIILRRAQAELRQSEARARLLLEHVPAVVWTTDGDLYVSSVAGRDLDALGMTAEEVIGRGLTDVIDAGEHDGLTGVLAAHHRALAGQRASYDARVGERTFHGTVEPLRDESGRIVGCAGLGLEVTRRRRVEDAFGGKLRVARRRLEALAGRGGELGPEHQALVEEVLESSSVAVEELQVTAEELSQQNEELAAMQNDLAASQRRYVDLFEAAPDGYLVTDLAGVIRQANRAAVDLLGVREELLRNKLLVLYVAEGERAAFHRKLDRVLREGELDDAEWEMRVRPHEGDAFPAALTVSPIRDREGALSGLRWLLRDISASRRAEERERLLEETRVAAEEAQAANTLLRTLLDVMPVGVMVCNADGALLMTNHPGREILGGRAYGDIETPQRTYEPCYPDGSPFPASEMPLVRAMQLGETVENVELLIRREDGSERAVLAGAAPVRDEAGEVVSGVAVFQDISARKQAEKALEKERARLEAVIESAPEGIVVSDAEARILMTNPAADALYARPVPYGEDYGSHKSLLLCAPDGTPCEPRDLPLTRAALDGEVVADEELIILWPDGQQRELLVNAAPVWGGSGEALGAVALFQDISARKQAEEALERQRNLLQTVMENTHAHLAYLDANFNFVMVNSAYAAGTAYDEEELVGRNHFDLFPDSENRAIFERVRETGEPVTFQAKPFEFPDQPERGATYWNWMLAPVKGNGEVQGLVLSLLDVTERERSRRALLESEERFRTVADFTYDWEYWVAPDGRYLYVSPSCQRITGYSADEFLRDPELMLSIVHPVDREMVTEHFDQSSEDDEEHYLDFRILTRDGEERWINHVCQPVYSGDGTYLGRRGGHRDITKRKQAEQALRRYADRLQGLHETDQAILASRSVDEIAEAALARVPQLLDCVRASVMLYDLDAGEMWLLAVRAGGETRLEKGWRSGIDAEWRQTVQDLRRGATVTIEDVQQAPSGSPWREALRAEQVRALIVTPLIIEGELIGSLNLGMREPGLLTTGRMEIARELAIQLAIGIRQARLREQVRRHADVLEKRVEQRTAALRASQAHMQAIIENAPLGITLADTEGRILETNQAFQDMMGYSAQELCSMHFSDMTHPDDLEEGKALYQELTAGKRDRYSVEKRYVRKDGQALQARLSVASIRGPEDRMRYVVGLVEDVTEQRKAQEALIQAEKLAVTGRLAASLAHEINNPMQSVIGCLELARESLDAGDEEDVRELIQIAAEELDRAAGTVADLRDLNRPARDEEREPVDVNLQLEHVLVLTGKQCQKCGVEVEWEPAEDLPTLMLVPDRIKQVFLNLVLNALDAMPDGGCLCISTDCADDWGQVVVTFADTGRGIAADVLPNLFDPFYTTKTEGLGLGLYITRSVVEEHGGRIEVDSLLGEGTTFTVRLPVGQEFGEGGN